MNAQPEPVGTATVTWITIPQGPATSVWAAVVASANEIGGQYKALVLDANILIRTVPGQRVRRILESHADSISFFIPQSAYAEADEHLAALVVKRGGEPEKGLRLLRSLAALGTVMTHDTYADYEIEARKRLASRDPDDWPILAAALALGCPIWTEETDFFGCGVATWTSASIGSFLTQ
ncbi:PIN domain-containing protein [Paludibaculum fermentans]|uniref:PIN domain-containing protein n=1 Tax=Paludibaculum fermentans TaxID=1473598 RepID=UPI003EB905F7